MTRGLVYYSTKSQILSSDDVDQLIDDAEKRNQTMNITGFLTMNENHFVQYIEGAGVHLASLMSSIRKDERHNVVAEFSYDIQEKVCSKWSMKLINDRSIGAIQFPDLMISLLKIQKSEAFKREEV